MVAERITYAGRTVEVERYHINHIPQKGPRKKKKEESPERIKQSNLRKRTSRLRQLMNANFNDKEFWSMTLTYKKGEEPRSIRQVRNDASDFVSRLRKTAALFGTELKFIYVIGAGSHRRHVHITVNALPDMAIFRGCWTHGHVSMTPLYSDGQYRDLADYYIKNAQETKEQEEALGEKPGRMFSCSQNLKQPVVEKHIIPGRLKDEPKTIPGYYIEKDSVYKGFTSMGFPLIRYTLLKEEHEKSISMDRRAPKPVGQGKVHIPRSIINRSPKPRYERISPRSQSDSGHIGSIARGLKRILGKAKAACMRGVQLQPRIDRGKPEAPGTLGSERIR